MYGPLFFASLSAFNEKFDVQNDPDEVVIDLRESRVVDMSSIEALNKITGKYLKDGIIDANVMEYPAYKVAMDFPKGSYGKAKGAA